MKENNKRRSGIRNIIQQWAKAMHEGDMNGVLAHHAADIVVFDVPPPENDVRGIKSYRATWPPSFNGRQRERRLRSWNSTSPRATVLPTRTPYCAAGRRRSWPTILGRLRLTIGLRKDGGRWIVAHEHHSFPDKKG